MSLRIVVVHRWPAVSRVSAQSYEFRSTWKADDVQKLDMAGKKVAAVLISHDDSLRMSVEEALSRELTSRGPVGVAAYRTIPAELLRGSRESACVVRANRRGRRHGAARAECRQGDRAVRGRVVDHGLPGFQQLLRDWLGSAMPIRTREVTTIAVETLLFDVAKGKLIWGSVTESTNPKNVQTYIAGLAEEIAKELRREGLVTGARNSGCFSTSSPPTSRCLCHCGAAFGSGGSLSNVSNTSIENEKSFHKSRENVTSSWKPLSAPIAQARKIVKAHREVGLGSVVGVIRRSKRRDGFEVLASPPCQRPARC